MKVASTPGGTETVEFGRKELVFNLLIILKVTSVIFFPSGSRPVNAIIIIRTCPIKHCLKSV